MRGRLADPDDAAALVQALCDAAGLEATRDGQVLFVDDQAVVVVEAPVGQPLEEDELTSAYLRFRAGARRCLLVTPGLLSATDVGHRETLDPHFLHAGFDDLERMIDAVAA